MIILLILLTVGLIYGQNGKIEKIGEVGKENDSRYYVDGYRLTAYEYITKDGSQKCVIFTYRGIEKMTTNCFPNNKR